MKLQETKNKDTVIIIRGLQQVLFPTLVARDEPCYWFGATNQPCSVRLVTWLTGESQKGPHSLGERASDLNGRA
jgi:hypothetical protein